MNDNQTLARFFAHLWHGGKANFFCTDKYVVGVVKPKHKESYWFDLRGLDVAQITNFDNIPQTCIDGSGVFFSVHPSTQIPPESKKGNTDKRFIRSQVNYIAAVNCVYGEFDRIPLSELLEKDPSPNIVIRSGLATKHHAYWLLNDTYHITNEEQRDYIAHIQHAWVDYIGSEDESKNLNRVLRVPFTLNRKREYAPNFPTVGFVHVDFNRLHSLDELAAHLPAHVPRQSNNEQDECTDYDAMKIKDAVFSLAAWRCEQRNNEKGGWFEVLCALHSLGDTGEEIARAWSEKSCKYDDKDFDKVWKSISEKNNGLTVGSIYYWRKIDAHFESETLYADYHKSR